MMNYKVQAGDWICFQSMGRPIYGLVLYVNPGKIASTLGDTVVTTAGECYESSILEIRRPG